MRKKEGEIRLKKWQYKIRAEWGVHAREAVKLVRETKKYKSHILVAGERKAGRSIGSDGDYGVGFEMRSDGGAHLRRGG